MQTSEAAYKRIEDAAGGSIPPALRWWARLAARSPAWTLDPLVALLLHARAHERAEVLREVETPCWAGGRAGSPRPTEVIS